MAMISLPYYFKCTLKTSFSWISLLKRKFVMKKKLTGTMNCDDEDMNQDVYCTQ